MRKAFADAKVKALVVSRPEDVSYLSGFTGDDSVLVVGRGWACLITDGRYAEQAAGECRGIGIHVRKGEAMSAAIAEALKGRPVRRIAVQADHVTLQFHEALAKALKRRRIVPVAGVVEARRKIKDVAEVRAIRKAIAVAERAFKALLAKGARGFVGRTERRIAAELDYLMRLEGADRPAFETIVGAGSHGSLPHYRPGDRRIRRGDAVLIDWGAVVGGYCSDLTRVVFIGRISPRIGVIHEVVRRAQEAGIAALRPGVSGKSADAAARRVIEAAGYGENFVHGLGHGVGRQIHESPGISRTAKARLRPGMVVTVEPGIYLAGVGGVRIEDDVLITPKGRRRLSTLPRDAGSMVLR